ncbi:choice-of-anchor D domain-containing protein [Amycolatopsis sp. NBC_01307]|uniref:choice-of-anchor D domain-containing protein n=1 Tax=Amycolatopsis sp. NBC_01307 TaxID=2903561 RepID=UPI002E1558A2|nr:choice-of-anchor D domain-containing protein [Amycolatopsis sp. NBC_01307]
MLRHPRVPGRGAVAAGLAAVLLTVVVLAAPADAAANGVTARSSTGGSQPLQWNGTSSAPAISADGRYTVQLTTADVDPVDTSSPNQADVYATDRVTGSATLVGVAHSTPLGTFPPSGQSGQSAFLASSAEPSVSADGRYVALATADAAGNVDQAIPQGVTNAYVCDRDTNADGVFDELIPPPAPATQNPVRETYCTYVGDGTHPSAHPYLSADGSSVAWVDTTTDTVSVTRLTKDAQGRLQPPSAAAVVAVPPAAAQHENTTHPVLDRHADYLVYTTVVTVTLPFVTTVPEVVGYDFAAGRSDRLDLTASGSTYGSPATGPGVTLTAAAVSGDGARVAFQYQPAPDADPQVIVLDRDPDGDGARAPGAPGEPVTSTVVSRRTDGTDGDGANPVLSADGRYVAFVTAATGMHDGADTAGTTCLTGPQAFVVCQVVARDVTVDLAREAAATPRLAAGLVSATTTACTGAEGCGGNRSSATPAVSADGSVVSFASAATDLVAADTNNSTDVFQHRFTPQFASAGASFPTTPAGQSSSATLDVGQSGFGPLPVGPVTVTGPAAADFAVGAGQTCTGSTLYEGDRCALTVTFTPSATGARTASLALSSADGGTSTTIPLVGLGGAAPPPGPGRIEVTSGTTDFGPGRLLGTSAPKPVVLINRGGAPLVVTGVALPPAALGTDSFPEDYAISSDGCTGRTLVTFATCTVEFTHTPRAGGVRPATAEITDSTGATTEVLLTGSGVTPTLTITPAVSKPGRVVTVTATGLPVSTAMSITGLGPAQPVTTDAQGGFAVAYLLLPHSATGPLELTAQDAGGTVSARAGVLIQQRSSEPPDFTG